MHYLTYGILKMNTYKIELELLADDPPDWIVKAIEAQLEGLELLKYFDYTIAPMEDKQ